MTSILFRTTVMVLMVLLGKIEVSQVRAVAQVAQFIFGDSHVDQGNNNYLLSLSKANFKPNGIDLSEFNNQPTGRFCNGKLVSDFISDYMGTPSVLAYLDPDIANGQNLLRGTNFASAGSGILDESGAIFVQRIPSSQQLLYFQDAKSKIEAKIGQAASDQLIAKALFAFSTGGNDFINNYLLPASSPAAQYSVQNFTSLIINKYEQQLKQIYSYGARKILISNIDPIGCIPNILQSNSLDGSCVDSVNQIAIGFNALLKPMIDNLGPQLPGCIITYSDSYSLRSDMIQNPANYGFTSTTTACCGTGRFNGLIPCSEITSLCPDRDHYLFWDAFHPSEKANQIASQLLINGPSSAVTPINLSQLIPI